jgi:hypothetical protein
MCMPPQLHLTSLSGRRFPADPPRGKGDRLQAASGLLATAAVQLPELGSILLGMQQGASGQARAKTAFVQPASTRLGLDSAQQQQKEGPLAQAFKLCSGAAPALSTSGDTSQQDQQAAASWGDLQMSVRAGKQPPANAAAAAAGPQAAMFFNT